MSEVIRARLYDLERTVAKAREDRKAGCVNFLILAFVMTGCTYSFLWSEIGSVGYREILAMPEGSKARQLADEAMADGEISVNEYGNIRQVDTDESRDELKKQLGGSDAQPGS
jgi:hypothetical protein